MLKPRAARLNHTCLLEASILYLALSLGLVASYSIGVGPGGGGGGGARCAIAPPLFLEVAR